MNVYTPYEYHSNDDVYLERLAFINAFIEENEYTSVYIMGDFNAAISDGKSLFGQHLIQFCNDNKLILSSRVLLPAASFTVRLGIQLLAWTISYVQLTLMTVWRKLRSYMGWQQQTLCLSLLCLRWRIYLS